jgi:heme A synthase
MLRSKQFAWVNIVFALFIIIWGAYVRLSGSGAGCGEHWPLCNGDVIPLTDSFKTLVEFIHRITSGLFGITMLAMVYFSYKETDKNHPLRKASVLAFVLTIVEALIGAILVKKGLVEQNSSSLRAVVIATHLVNTMFLMAALLSCVYFSLKEKWKTSVVNKLDLRLFYIVSYLIIFVVTTGGITALGNTLFPSTSLAEGIINDFSSSSHFLIKLRIWHPICAILMGGLFFIFNSKISRYDEFKNLSDINYAIIVTAIGFGVVNWLLLAPTWGALVHLAIANVVWCAHILVGLRLRFK